MRIGTLVDIPNEYSRFGRVVDRQGVGYTVDKGDIPEGSSVGDELAYKVEIWGNDSGLAYDLEDGS